MKNFSNGIYVVMGSALIPIHSFCSTVSRPHAATPTQIEFGAAAQKIPVGDCAAIPVVTVDNTLHAVDVVKTTTVTIDQGAGVISFFTDASCKVKGTSLTIPVGQSSGNFYITGSKTGSYVIRIMSAGYNAMTQTEAITQATTSGGGSSGSTNPPPPPPSGNPPARIEFAAAAAKVPLTTCGQIPVELLDNNFKPAAALKPTTVTIDGGSGKVEFFSDASCKVKSTSFTIPQGQDSESFYIAGTATGSYQIRIMSSGYNAVVQTETITTAPWVAGAGCSGAGSAPPSASPSQAAAAGFNHLALDDEFNSTGNISPDGSGSFTWYTTNFFSASATLPNSGYSSTNGCLTILTDVSGYSDAIATADPSNTTVVFQHGYFEARMRFNPEGSQGGAWPAFWSYALEGIDEGAANFAELDFVEAYPTGAAGATILTTVHEWTTSSGGNTSVQQPNDVPTLPAGFDYNAFHIYGCLWSTNQVTWYIDNQPVMTVATGPGTNFPSLEKDHMVVPEFSARGKNWPMDVDWVHIWQ